jgi:hypothetical protein
MHSQLHLLAVKIEFYITEIPSIELKHIDPISF